MAKDIYRVVDTRTKKVVASGFSTKKEAKAIRNQRNEEANSTQSDDSKPRFVVARGEDHPRGSTDGVTVQKTPKSRKRRS